MSMSKGKAAACHSAFETHVKRTFGQIGCLNEYTLDRDQNGHYLNLSVLMEWAIWLPAWLDGANYGNRRKGRHRERQD
jgi:hypothetical protein